MKKMRMVDLLEATRGEYEWQEEVMSPGELRKIKKALSNPAVHAAAKALADLPVNVTHIIFNPEIVKEKYGVALTDLLSPVASQEHLRKSSPSRATGDFEESPINSNEERYRDKDRVARMNRSQRRNIKKLYNVQDDTLKPWGKQKFRLDDLER